MKDAFHEYLSVDLDELSDVERLKKELKAHDVACAEDDTWEMLFNRLFLTHVETRLPKSEPVILYDYPSRIPTLAKHKNHDYYERWELYINGIEIANCFTEETDEKKLAEFFVEETSRKSSGRIQHKIDTDFIKAFSGFYPACAGTALGLDRLFMCMYGISSIESALLFPFRNIE
jgi:lysyl-tRNA synthetase class 2